MPLYRHKRTGNILEAKSLNVNAGSFYLLNDEFKRIEDGFNCKREKAYKIRVCLIKNVEILK